MNFSHKIDREIALLRDRKEVIKNKETEIIQSNKPEDATELEQLIKERVEIDFQLMTKYGGIINWNVVDRNWMFHILTSTSVFEQFTKIFHLAPPSL